MPSSDPSNVSPSRPLARALVTLAGTPADAPGVGARLAVIAGLAVDRVAAVVYASVTEAAVRSTPPSRRAVTSWLCH